MTQGDTYKMLNSRLYSQTKDIYAQTSQLIYSLFQGQLQWRAQTVFYCHCAIIALAQSPLEQRQISSVINN